MKNINSKMKIKSSKDAVSASTAHMNVSWFHLETALDTLLRHKAGMMKYLGARAKTRQISITKQGESL